MSITSANAVLMLSVSAVFPAPVQLQEFGADDIYDSDDVDAAETSMGVDGVLTAGFVNVPINQRFTLQADSPSIAYFDQWFLYNLRNQETFPANMTTTLTSVGAKFNHTKGYLIGYKYFPDAKKVLQPRRFAIRWQNVVPSPVVPT